MRPHWGGRLAISATHIKETALLFPARSTRNAAAAGTDFRVQAVIGYVPAKGSCGSTREVRAEVGLMTDLQ